MCFSCMYKAPEISIDVLVSQCIYFYKMNDCLLSCGHQDDLNLSGYRKFLTSQAAPLPLTAAEEELRQIKLNEVQPSTEAYRNMVNHLAIMLRSFFS